MRRTFSHAAHAVFAGLAILVAASAAGPARAQSAEGETPAAAPTPRKVRLRPAFMKKESVRLEPVLAAPDPTAENASAPETSASEASASEAPAPEVAPAESSPAESPATEATPAPESVQPAERAPASREAAPSTPAPARRVTPSATPAPAPAPAVVPEPEPEAAPEPAPAPEPVVVSEPPPAVEAVESPTSSPESPHDSTPRPTAVRLERTGSIEAEAKPSEPESKPSEPSPASGTSTAPPPAEAPAESAKPAEAPAPDSARPPTPPTPRALEEDPAATQLLVQVRTAIDSGDTAGGRVMGIRLAERYPDSTAAPEALLLASSGLDDLAGAVRELLSLADRYPDSPAAAAALVRAGEFSFILGDHPGAVSAFERYLARPDAAPDRLPQVESRRALALLRCGRFPESRAAFEALFDARDEMMDSPEMLESYAESLLGLGDHVAAKEILDRVDGRFPSYENAVRVMLGRGLCAEIRGETEVAGQIYSTIVTNYPSSLEAPLAGRRIADLGRPLVP